MHDVLVQTRRNKHAAVKLMREFLKNYGVVPDKMVTDDLRSYGAAAGHLGIANVMSAGDGATIGRRIRISLRDKGKGKCKVSRAWDPRKDFSQRMPPTTLLMFNAISFRQERTAASRAPARVGKTWVRVGATRGRICYGWTRGHDRW